MLTQIMIFISALLFGSSELTSETIVFTDEEVETVSANPAPDESVTDEGEDDRPSPWLAQRLTR